METMIEEKLSIDKTNWTPVKFGDVVFEPKESSKDPHADGIEHVVGLEHIEPENIHLKNSATLEESTTFTKRFAIGDVLFGRRRAYLKKAAQASFSGICSGDITVFRANEKLMSELLPFIVNNEKFFDYAVKHSAGGLSPRVKFKDLANYEFLLPPKDQQAQLAKLLWAMDDVIEKNKEVLNTLEINYASTVKSIFEKEKNLIKLKQIKFEYFKGLSAEEDENSDFILIPSGAVFPRKLKIEKSKNVNISNKKSFSKILNRNDILFNTGGVGTLGRSHFFSYDDNKYFCDSFVLVLRFKDENYSNKFIYHILQSNPINSQIVQNTKGTTGITSISIDGIRNFRIPNLKFEEQLIITNKLDKIEFSIFDFESKIKSSQSLKKSLINQIF
jgi:type I restriction enzyme, S subunit